MGVLSMSEVTDAMLRFEAKSVRFFAQLDEVMFFKWLDAIDAIHDYAGAGESIFMWVDHPSDEEVRELIAFFHRYHIDKQQLSALLTDDNRSWFADEKMVWHSEIFGRVQSS